MLFRSLRDSLLLVGMLVPIIVPNFVGAFLLVARRATCAAWLRVGSLATLVVMVGYGLLLVTSGQLGFLVQLLNPLILLPTLWAISVFVWLKRPAIRQQIRDEWPQSTSVEATSKPNAPFAFSILGALVGGIVGGFSRACAA